MGKKKDIYCINCGKFIESTRWPGLKYHVCEECKRERHGGSVSESVSESEGRSESGAGVGSQTRTYEYERVVSPESFRDRWPMLSIGLLFFGGWILALVIIILEGNFMRDFPLCLMTLFIIIIPLVCYFAYSDFKKQKSMGWR